MYFDTSFILNFQVVRWYMSQLETDVHTTDASVDSVDLWK